MSQYVSIFLDNKNGEFIKIGYFSCNSNLGKYFYAISPYGKVHKLTDTVIGVLREDINYDIERNKESMKKHRYMIESVERYNNTTEEKYERICKVYADIVDLEDEIKDMNYALDYLDVISSIIDCSGWDCCFGIEVSPENIIYEGNGDG